MRADLQLNDDGSPTAESPIAPLWDAFLDVTRTPMPTIPRVQAGWRMAFWELQRAGVTPAELRQAIVNYRQTWPKMLATPQAISKWLHMFREAKTYERATTAVTWREAERQQNPTRFEPETPEQRRERIAELVRERAESAILYGADADEARREAEDFYRTVRVV